MANEYLKRTPTSTGNRKVWTVAFWHKRNATSAYNNFYTTQASTPYLSVGNFNSDGTIQICRNESATVTELNSTSVFKDLGSWMHIMVVWDTTSSTSSDRAKLYVNGILQPTNGTYPSQNYEGGVNRNVIHSIGTVLVGGVPYAPTEPKGEWTDYFFVDGQALTPDVFGYYKKGDGYISAGSAQATDFKKGQWVPKAPKVIKSVINARGGFGVNGFYLPMNEGTNFGADLHCAPNSIIKLKGEDEPQPYYGAPDTTDAYVSQLRTDPYKDYLVFAMPGVPTSTSANLVTNGNFYTGVSNWTAEANATLTHNEGAMRITVTATAGATQSITVVDGERYILSFKVRTDGTNFSNFQLNHSGGTTDYFGVNISHTDWRTYSISFVADGTSVTLKPYKATSGWVEYDDIVVKQQGVPRDYSADIKGSGTNKTIALSPGTYVDSGFALGIPGYYGSAVSLNDDATQGLLLGWGEGDPDYNFGTGDFTMEAWVYPSVQDAGYWSVLRSRRYSGADGSGLALYGYQDGFRMWERTSSSSGATNIHGGDVGSAPAGQWTHIALVRHNGRILSFCNGVCVGNTANTVYYENNGFEIGQTFPWQGYIQDVRIYKGVAKYKNGFDIVKPYTPVGIATWRAVSDTTANNFATLNPLSNGNVINGANSTISYTNGNSTVSWSGVSNNATFATVGFSTGQWYWEGRIRTVGGAYPFIGISSQVGISSCITIANNGIAAGSAAGPWYGNNGLSADDVIGIAVGFTNTGIGSTFRVFKNGTEVTGQANYYYNSTNFTNQTNTWVPSVSAISSVWDFNFGQNPTFSGQITAGTYTDSNGKGLFKYQPPSGFLALCEDNLPTPAIADPGKHFKTVLWTGDGNSGHSIAGVGFTPDLVWGKSRTTTHFHTLQDSVRGAGFSLYANSTAVEEATTGMIQSFNSDGFTVGSAGNALNNDGENYVAWCWKAGGPAVSNTDGSITSQVSANQTAGFSIATFTTTLSGSGTESFGHGLGKAPSMVIVKARDLTASWGVYHKSIGPTGLMYLQLPNAINTAAFHWGDTAPTDSVVTLGAGSATGSAADRVAYCWAEIEGFSKFGSYVGNGDPDGPFVYCGFKPAFVIAKSTSASDNWRMYDSSRGSTNPQSPVLYPNLSLVESIPSHIDLLSNGFKWRTTNNNATGVSYIFIAFAESPFTTANAK